MEGLEEIKVAETLNPELPEKEGTGKNRRQKGAREGIEGLLDKYKAGGLQAKVRAIDEKMNEAVIEVV